MMVRQAFLIMTSIGAPAFSYNQTARAPSLRYPQETSNVRDFGAKGDAITDDLAAINKAIVAAAAGGRVLFPAGSYLVSATISVSKPDIALAGVGTDSRLVPRTAGFNLVTLKSA